VSTFGGLAARRAARLGIQGVVINGACRDIEELMQVGLHVRSRYVSPRSGRTRLRIEAVNEELEIDGVTIQPGDLVASDRTGIVVVPAAVAGRASELALALTRADEQLANSISRGSAPRRP